MSLNLDSVVEFIGAIAPTTFVIAVTAGIVGNLAYSWFYRRLMFRHLGYFDDLEKKLGAIQYAQAPERSLSPQDIERLKTYLELLSLDERLIEKKNGADLVASRVAKLGEYLSNHSPADSLTRGAAK